MRPRSIVLALLVFGSGLVLLRGTDLVDAEEAGDKEDITRKNWGWGKLGREIKDSEGLHEFTLYRRDARGKLHSEKVLLEVSESVTPYFDRRIRPADVEQGDDGFVFGRPADFEVRGGGGRGGGLGGGRSSGRDYQIQNVLAVLVGKEIDVNQRYKNPDDPTLKWCKGSVSRDGSKGLWFDYDSNEYRVLLGRQAPVLKREKVNEKIKKKLLRSGAYVYFRGEVRDERPATLGSKYKDRVLFRVRQLVILDKASILNVYPLVF